MPSSNSIFGNLPPITTLPSVEDEVTSPLQPCLLREEHQSCLGRFAGSQLENTNPSMGTVDPDGSVSPSTRQTENLMPTATRQLSSEYGSTIWGHEGTSSSDQQPQGFQEQHTAAVDGTIADSNSLSLLVSKCNAVVLDNTSPMKHASTLYGNMSPTTPSGTLTQTTTCSTVHGPTFNICQGSPSNPQEPELRSSYPRDYTMSSGSGQQPEFTEMTLGLIGSGTGVTSTDNSSPIPQPQNLFCSMVTNTDAEVPRIDGETIATRSPVIHPRPAGASSRQHDSHSELEQRATDSPCILSGKRRARDTEKQISGSAQTKPSAKRSKPESGLQHTSSIRILRSSSIKGSVEDKGTSRPSAQTKPSAKRSKPEYGLQHTSSIRILRSSSIKGSVEDKGTSKPSAQTKPSAKRSKPESGLQHTSSIRILRSSSIKGSVEDKGTSKPSAQTKPSAKRSKPESGLQHTSSIRILRSSSIKGSVEDKGTSKPS